MRLFLRLTTTAVLIVTPAVPTHAELRGSTADAVVSLAPAPGACFVKRFDDCAGLTIVGVRLLSNDRATVFPRVEVIQGVQASLSTGVVIRHVTDVRPDVGHGALAAFAPLLVRDTSPIFVSIEFPAQGDRASAKGIGVGIGAWQLEGQPDSFIAPTREEPLQAIDVSLAIEFVTSDAAKPTASQATAAFIRVASPHATAAAIRFGLGKQGRVAIAIYDIAGRRVRLLLDDERGAGLHETRWDGLDDSKAEVAAGVYLVRMTTVDREFVQKIVRTR